MGSLAPRINTKKFVKSPKVHFFSKAAIVNKKNVYRPRQFFTNAPNWHKVRSPVTDDPNYANFQQSP